MNLKQMEKTMKSTMRPLNQRARISVGLSLLMGLAIALAVVTAGALHVRAISDDGQDILKLNRFVQNGKTDTPSNKVFRDGRDQIEAGNWQQAAEKFQTFTKEYPKDRDLDAALYWLAYADKKQDKKDEATQYLLRLVKEFPRSSWRQEAVAMLIELGHKEQVRIAVEQIKTDNENCEIKILALQSLFQADEERAISFVSEVLKSDSACKGLKSAAVSLLGSRGGTRATPILLELARGNGDLSLRLIAIRQLGAQNTDAMADELARIYEVDHTRDIRIQILRAFAGMRSAHADAKLIEAARAADDVEVRQYAIRYLGEKKGDASLDELIRIFDTDRTPVIRMQVLRALGQREDPKAHAKLLEVARQGETPELRVQAIRELGGRGGASFDELLQLYNTETNQTIKEGLLRSYGDMNDARAFQKLFEVARSAEPFPLRQVAINQLGNHDRDKPAITAELIGMYDAEQNVQVRGALIRAFGDSKEKAAVTKLIAIARGDSSVDLRKLAIRFLGESKDPDALKFLEELLK
jgi:HEAT repeat protein